MKFCSILTAGLCCLLGMTACVSSNNVASWHPDASREDIAKIESKDVRAVVERNDATVALMKHDTKVLLTTAEQLKKIENEKKVSDPFWNSRNIYATAAVFAMGQDDEKSFQRIVDNEPDFAAMRPLFPGKTRGGIVCKTIAIPQIVEVKSVEEAAKLPPEKRAFWGMYAKKLYPEISDRKFTIICNKINISRSILEAEVLAETAIELSKFKSLDAPPCFQAKQLFREAVDMAVLMMDSTAMKNIVEMSKKAPSFVDAKEQKQLEAEMKAMGKTRGWNERKIARLNFVELEYSDGSVRTVSGDDWSNFSYSGSNVRVKQYSGHDALAYQIKKFYER